MLDYLRNLKKSDEEKRQEMLTAYLDDALKPKQRQEVESDLAQDEGLTAELDQMRLLQQEMRQLPQRRVRRNFTLDPALYGRPQREPLVQAYPVLRTATVMAAFLFIFVLAANVFFGGTGGMMSGAESAAVDAVSREEAIAEAPVEEVEEAQLMIEAESIEEAAEAPFMTEAEPIEEAAEAPFMLEEVEIASEFDGSADEAEGTFEKLNLEADEAAPMEGAAPPEITEADSPMEERALSVVPTMTAEGTARAEQAGELSAVVTAEAVELAELPETRSPAISGDGEDTAASAPSIQAPRDGNLFAANGLELLVLFLGIVFVVLIVLTLLARHRF